MTDFPFKIITTSYDPAQAELHLQYTGMESFDGAAWKGSVIGPYCHGRQTIAIAHPLVPGNDDTFMARIPEPCYWSPTAPFLYELLLDDTESQLKYRHGWGLQSLVIKRSQFLLNQEKLTLRGVRLTQPLTTELASTLKQADVNLLVIPLSQEATTIASLADLQGLCVLYEVNPDEDELLWHAESVLFQHISTLGFVLPQSAMLNPQLWHNAMLHLHRQRRDVFIGISIETVPLSMVQGHVEFILSPVQFMPELAEVKMPALGLVRRFDLLHEELPINWAGRVSRVPPSE
jgi:hypothetical protein